MQSPEGAQGRQGMMDYHQDEPVMPRAAVSAAIFREGRVLLVKRRMPPLADLWSLPGGHIEPGETALDAVHRELREETGIAARMHDIAAVKDIVQRNDRGVLISHRVVIVFSGEWLSGDVEAGDDAASAGWYDTESLVRLATTEELAEIVMRAKTKLANI